MPKVKVQPVQIETEEAPEETPPVKPPALIRLLFRPRLLLLLAAAATAAATAPLLKSVLPDLKNRAEYRVGAESIIVSQPPAWVPSNFVEQTLERAQLREMSVLDDDLNERVAAAFQSHPWVANVVAVRKSKPARVDVELLYRAPIALVQMKQGVYPVDSSAVLLPPADFTADDLPRYPLIVNAASPPQGPAGTPWGDVGVQGAARLAEVLAPRWKEFQLAAISIPRRDAAATAADEIVYTLFTSGGSRIIWGRASETGDPGELSPAQKVDRLSDYLARFGSFDRPHGPYEIDIRHWQDMTRRPLTSTGR